MSINRFYVISPLALVALSACKQNPAAGGGITGNIVKGPLSNALVFLDLDGDNVLDTNEQSVRTDADGKFTINSTASNYKIVALTDESTVDTSSGAILSGVTLSAPKGASVVTPTTTLMEEGGLTKEEVAEVLGLPDGVDPLTFNPFAADVDAATALAVEKVSQQLMTAVSSFASAAEGAGASEKGAFEAALKSVVDVVKTKAAKAKDPNASAADKKIDFTKADDLELIKAQVTTKAAALDGIDMTTMNAIANDTRDAIKNVNDTVATVTDLKSDTTKNIFSTTQVLKDQVKNASVDKKAGKVANIAFKNKAEVDKEAKNKAPEDIKLTGDGTIHEYASSLIIGTVSTVDTDQKSGTAFKYKLTGKDADFFSLNERTGELSLKAKPDYATKTSYELTIVTEDSGGKKYAETFTINVVKAKAGEVYESSLSGNTTFLIVDGSTSGKFDVIPVKVKSGGSGYEFDASNKTKAAYDVAANKLSESIGRDPTKKTDASNSDASTAVTAAQTALTPAVAITAFADSRHSIAVADGATSKDVELYLKFTLSDSSTDFVAGDITVTGGTLSGFTGRGKEYEAVFTPSGSSKVATKLNIAKDKFTNDYFGNTAAMEFNWTYDPSSSGSSSSAEKSGEVYESSLSGNTTFLIVDSATSGKFGVIPVKVKSGGSGYEFDASKKTEAAYDVAPEKLKEIIGREPTKKADASNSDISAAITAVQTALTPSVTITAFSDRDHTKAVADGATSNHSEIYLKFTLSDSSTDFIEDDITVTGGILDAFKGTRTDYTAVFTRSGSNKVATTLNIAKDKFTNDYFGNTAATEFNWTYDPDNGLKDGDVVKEIKRGTENPTGKLLLLDIDAGKYSLVPVKDNGSGKYIFDIDNKSAIVSAKSNLSDTDFKSVIGSSPTGNGDTISSSDAAPILKQAGITPLDHGDVVKAVNSSGAATNDLFLVVKEAGYGLIPVEKNTNNKWVLDTTDSPPDSAFSISGQFIREIGETPFLTGDTISDSDIAPILTAAKVNVSLYGDEKGGSKAFKAGDYDAAEDNITPDSDGIGWILKGVKSFGETTTAKASRSNSPDIDNFLLVDLSSTKLKKDQKYKVTVTDENWDGNDSGDIARVKVLTELDDEILKKSTAGAYEFTADGSSEYFLEIMGEGGKDAQYSMIFEEIV